MLIYRFTYLWLPTMDFYYFHTQWQHFVEIMSAYIMEAKALHKKTVK